MLGSSFFQHISCVKQCGFWRRSSDVRAAWDREDASGKSLRSACTIRFVSALEASDNTTRILSVLSVPLLRVQLRFLNALHPKGVHSEARITFDMPCLRLPVCISRYTRLHPYRVLPGVHDACCGNFKSWAGKLTYVHVPDSADQGDFLEIGGPTAGPNVYW